jgi:hypothetical protein
MMNQTDLPKGWELVELLAELSGLSQDWAAGELERLLEKQGINIEQVTLDEVRGVLAELLASLEPQMLH